MRIASSAWRPRSAAGVRRASSISSRRSTSMCMGIYHALALQAWLGSVHPGPGDGTVAKCSLSGCTKPTILASGQATPVDIAVDSTSVYWANQGSGNGTRDGSVSKTAK
jgi:hypothetical protein